MNSKEIKSLILKGTIKSHHDLMIACSDNNIGVSTYNRLEKLIITPNKSSVVVDKIVNSLKG